MRKNRFLSTLTFFVFFLLAPFVLKAQGADFSNARLFGAGFSASYRYDYGTSRSLNIPPAMAYLEVGVHQYITIGPFAAFSRWSYPTRQQSFLSLGARGSFHLSPLFNDLLDGSIDEQKIDFYVSMLSGFELRQYGADDIHPVSRFMDNAKLFFGPLLGVRYYFSDDAAIFSEIGRGALGALTIGVSFKL